MGRISYGIAAVVVLSLVVPAVADDAVAADSVVECGFGAQAIVNGRDGDTPVASYKVLATWCVETVYETRTISEEPTADPSVSGADEGTKVEKDTKKGKKGKKGRKAKRRRARRDRDEQARGPRTRTERRVVSTCITDFQVDGEAAGIDVGVDLIDATTKDVGSTCDGRAFRVEGRFGRDYVRGVPSETRSVLQETVSGITFQNYPLGRLGVFDVTVRFVRTGGASCDACVAGFEFCDVRIVSSSGESCVHLE